MPSRLFLTFGAVAAMLAVVLGAFGAHALRARLSVEMLTVYQTGVQYHFWHALGLLVIGLLATRQPDSSSLRWSGYLMAAGLMLFSGSLYLLALSGTRWLGAITPIGGVALVVAWLLLAVAAWRGA